MGDKSGVSGGEVQEEAFLHRFAQGEVMRRLIALIVPFVITAVVAGCGSSAGPLTTAPAVVTTTAAPTATTLGAAEERAFMARFIPAVQEFFGLLANQPAPADAESGVGVMVANWETVVAPTERTQMILDKWLAFAEQWREVFRLKNNGDTADASALIETMKGEGVSAELGSLMGAIATDLGITTTT